MNENEGVPKSDGLDNGSWVVDISKLTLALRRCPNCGRHGQVLVMLGETVHQTIPVTTRKEARSVNQDLVESGGNDQPEFLTAVEDADYLLGEEPAFSLGAVVVSFGGVVVISSGRKPNLINDLRGFLRQADLTGAELVLTQCSCGQHAVVTLKLKDGTKVDVEAPKTKEEACRVLEHMFRYRSFPDSQPEYVEAIRQAEWLPGPMPVEI